MFLGDVTTLGLFSYLRARTRTRREKIVTLRMLKTEGINDTISENPVAPRPFKYLPIYGHTGLCFVCERPRSPRHYQGHSTRKLYISTGAFRGHKGNDQRA